jgi:Astacin (Peptidase family M12A)
VAYLDQVLAAVPSGQKTARLGDMEILVANLVAWRDRLAGMPTPRSAFDGTAPTWTGGNVYYTFSTSGTNAVAAAQQRVFVDCCNEWATFANIHFIPWTTQANYVMVVQQTNFEGGFSAVGMIGGQQILEIGPTSWNHPTVCHELGHTLGLVHEHQRSDRNSFVTIYTNNIIPATLGNFVLLSDSRNQTPYDFLSIMHYSRNTFSTNYPTLDTIEPLPAYSQYLNIMGQQFDPVLSADDRAGMAAIYGAGPVNTNIVTNTQDSGPGSLRAALYYAFDHPGTTINFNIPGTNPGRSNNVFNIQPTDRLPSLVNTTTIDGSTEPVVANPNGPSILLSGVLAQPPSLYANGLRLGGTNCTVRSLVVNGFSLSGILIDSSNAVGNVVAGCYLGIDPSGNFPVTNYFSPITIDNGASGNTIGGTNASARNILSGSPYQGLVIRDPGTISNVVQGNYIGLNAAGNAPLSNTWSGVAIFNGAQSNLIGGAAASMRNIISGNGLQGITISDPGTTGNIIEGNYIGLNPAGTAAISNGWSGVNIFSGASGNSIGIPGGPNIISGNALQGIIVSDQGSSNNIVQGNYIGLDPTGMTALSNGWAGIEVYNGPQANLIGGTVPGARNVISGNGLQGVILDYPGTSDNLVQGNYIGLNAAGTSAVPNAAAGVVLYNGAQANLIGGTIPTARNIISGNNFQGVFLQFAGTASNLVQGNYIGLNPAGTVAIPNGFAGMEIYGGPQANLIGGTIPGARNVVSGNTEDGIILDFPGTSGNIIQGNYIGLDAAGTAAISNGFAGLEIYNGPQSNIIGGTLSGAGNVISGNGEDGVIIDFPGTSGNMIQGNYIGLNSTGTAAISNSWNGIEIYNGAQANTVGGSVPGAGNVLSGNGLDGILIDYTNADNNLVQGNYIGLDAAGRTALPNGSYGVEMYNSANNNIIGGVAGARNFIAGNLNAGVAIDYGSSGNVIQGNSIGQSVTNGPVPNGAQGVVLFQGAQLNQIGGLTFGAANDIGDNSSDGIDLYDSTTTGNSIRGNSLFGNSTGGLDLISGANLSAAPPTLSTAVVTTNTVVIGNLTGLPSTTFHVDFYLSPPPQAQAQAAIYLGAQDIATSSGGSVNFSADVPCSVPIARIVTATATDPTGNTSFLSAGVTVTAIDSVGDGIPDAWRRAHFGGTGTTTNSQSCAACDPDHDGLTNYQEFLAGTNPTNAASTLKMGTPAGNGLDIHVNFQSVSGTVYRVSFRDDIAGNGWTILADQIIGTGGVIQITDSGAASLPKRFYRLEVLP